MPNAPIHDTPECDTLDTTLELHFKSYPMLTRFMDFWRENAEAKLHSVNVASTKILEASTYQTMQAPFRIH